MCDYRKRGGEDDALQGTHGAFKKRKIDADNGDRYCVYCGLLIFGQLREKLTVCPQGRCRKPIPFTGQSWAFGTGWWRCKGISCGMFIEGSMKYCQACGTPNTHAFERQARKEAADRQAEKAKHANEVKALKEKLAAVEAENVELQTTVKIQEQQIAPFNVPQEVAVEDLNDEEINKMLVDETEAAETSVVKKDEQKE